MGVRSMTMDIYHTTQQEPNEICGEEESLDDLEDAGSLLEYYQ